jgi:hypothetical protein
MHMHPNEMANYVTKKAIAMISIVAAIIDCNISLRDNKHDYCNNIKNCCKATLLLATTFNQSNIVVIERCCNKYGSTATIFHHGNRPIF